MDVRVTKRQSILNRMPRRSHVRGLALRLWREQRHQMLEKLGKQAALLTEWQRKLENRNRENDQLKTRIFALKNGAAVDPATVENINGLQARLIGQREEIKKLRSERDEARAALAASEAGQRALREALEPVQEILVSLADPRKWITRTNENDAEYLVWDGSDWEAHEVAQFAVDALLAATPTAAQGTEG